MSLEICQVESTNEGFSHCLFRTFQMLFRTASQSQVSRFQSLRFSLKRIHNESDNC